MDNEKLLFIETLRRIKKEMFSEGESVIPENDIRNYDATFELGFLSKSLEMEQAVGNANYYPDLGTGASIADYGLPPYSLYMVLNREGKLLVRPTIGGFGLEATIKHYTELGKKMYLNFDVIDAATDRIVGESVRDIMTPDLFQVFVFNSLLSKLGEGRIYRATLDQE